VTATASAQRVPANLIRAGHNHRQTFDADGLEELARSIRTYGLQTPPTVRPVPTGDGEQRFELICGERRFRAMTEHLGWDTIPVFIEAKGDRDARIGMMIENLCRRDVSPLEEAKGYRLALDDFGLTVAELAASIGIGERSIENRLTLLFLSPEMQAAVPAILSVGYAFDLADGTKHLPPDDRHNLQTILFQRLHRNPSPTQTWWRKEVGGLVAEAEQQGLFGGDWSAAALTRLTDWTPPSEPALPGRDKPPEWPEAEGADLLTRQAEWWEEQATRWVNHFGKPVSAERCRASAGALRTAAERLGTDPGVATALAMFVKALSKRGVDRNLCLDVLKAL